MRTRPLDVVLYGATGFTGRQTARYLAEHAPTGLRWAVAGRRPAALDALCAELQVERQSHPERSVPSARLVADGEDVAALDALAAQARVVASTAGPFSRYGTALVAACTRRGTDYVDITGETPWVRGLIDAHHEQAAAAGTRIIPLCGFDSVPSDLGVLALVDHIRRVHGVGVRKISGSFVASFGVNGGTLASALALGEAGQLAALADPVLLNPPHRRTPAERARARDLTTARFDADRRTWLVPFVMARINTRVVRRSESLLADWGQPYGARFSYEESMETRSRIKARGITAASAALDRALTSPLVRRLIARVAPRPGEGPSASVMDNGFFRARFIGEAEDGSRASLTLFSHGDPGNRVTVKLLCEAALMLATTPREALVGGAARGGLLTPATGLGLPYLSRLESRGLALTLEPLSEALT